MFRSLRRKLFRLIVVSGAGAAANYFFDSERGPQRRAQAKDQANGLLKRTGDAGGAAAPANIFDTPTSSGSVTGALRTDAGAAVPHVADALVTPDTPLGGDVGGFIVDPAPGQAPRPGSVGGA